MARLGRAQPFPSIRFKRRALVSPSSGEVSFVLNATEKFITLSALTGSSVTLSQFIPAGCYVLRVIYEVLQVVTGATSIDVGDAYHRDRWASQGPVSAGARTSMADFTIETVPLYTRATNVMLSANGGNFTGGSIKVTCDYITL